MEIYDKGLPVFTQYLNQQKFSLYQNLSKLRLLLQQ